MTLLLAAAVAAYVVLRKPPKEPAHADDHTGGTTGTMNAVRQAVLQAPEGATPCETAWNGFDTLDRKLTEVGQPRPTERHPDRATFLAVCEGFSGREQLCLGPRYKANHRPECDGADEPLWVERDGGKPNLATIFGKRQSQKQDGPAPSMSAPTRVSP